MIDIDVLEADKSGYALNIIQEYRTYFELGIRRDASPSTQNFNIVIALLCLG